MAWRITTWWKRTYEGLRRRVLFHLVSLSFANFPGRGVVVFVVGLVGGCLVFVVFVCFSRFSRGTSAFN